MHTVTDPGAWSLAVVAAILVGQVPRIRRWSRHRQHPMSPELAATLARLNQPQRLPTAADRERVRREAEGRDQQAFLDALVRHLRALPDPAATR